MSIFDDIKTGLNQAIDFEKGKGKARVTVMTIHPVDQFSPDEIKQIRTDTGMIAGAVCAVYGCFRKNRGGMGSRQKSSGRSRLPPSCHDKKRS